MNLPYIKKIGEKEAYKIFYVDGFFIRNNYDKEFTNFGSSKYFKFIPKNEFWIDYENKNNESKYFIDNFIMIQEQLKGKTYDEAVKIANKFELKKRNKSRSIKKIKNLSDQEILKKVHRKQLFKKFTKNINIWLVRGELVRSLFYIDFTEGGHDKVYKFIPKNEIWLDDSLNPKEIPYVLIHELHERYLMKKGWNYDSGGIGVFSRKAKKGEKSAHFSAEKIETYARNNPNKAKEILIKEIKKQ